MLWCRMIRMDFRLKFSKMMIQVLNSNLKYWKFLSFALVTILSIFPMNLCKADL